MTLSASPLQWSDWPAPRLGWRAALAGAVVVVVGALAALYDPLAGLVSTLLLVVSTGEVLLPSEYRLDAEGVEVRRLLGNRALRWDELSGWRAARGGFLLLRPQVSRWRRSRQPLLLRCPGREDEVRSWLILALGQAREAA